MKKSLGLSLLAATLLASAPLALAAGAPQLSVTSIGNDRYVAGSDVTVNQAVVGDLSVAGGTVTVNAPVSGTLQAAGGTVIVNNTVSGNIRIFGGTVILQKPVKGNVMVAGGTVRVQKGADIGGSVLTLGGDTTIDSTINGGLKARGGMLTVNGLVKGELDLQGDNVQINGHVMGSSIIAARSITMGTNAAMDKDLRYWTPTGAQTFGKAVKGKTTYDVTFAMHEPRKDDGLGMLAAFITAVTIYSILSGAVMIGLFVLLSKTFFKDAAKILKTKPGMSFLIGLLYFLVTPIATILLLITVIGLPIAIAIALLFVLSLLFAKALTAIVFTRYFEMQYKKKWNSWAIFGISLGIFLLLKLISIVPVIGWIVTTVSVLLGYGAVLWVKYEKFKKVM